MVCGLKKCWRAGSRSVGVRVEEVLACGLKKSWRAGERSVGVGVKEVLA